MGRVKELLPDHDDYKAQDNGEEQELEVLAIDAEMARDRYLAALSKLNARKAARHESV